MDGRRQPARLAARLHLVIGIVAIIALPAVSLATRTGGLAFTMFSGSGSYRLRVVMIDDEGRERRVPPTAIAAHARGSIGDALAGSEDWRFAPFGSLVRRRLDYVAALACETMPQSRQARVTLDERRTWMLPSAPLQRRPDADDRRRRRCARPRTRRAGRSISVAHDAPAGCFPFPFLAGTKPLLAWPDGHAHFAPFIPALPDALLAAAVHRSHARGGGVHDRRSRARWRVCSPAAWDT